MYDHEYLLEIEVEELRSQREAVIALHPCVEDFPWCYVCVDGEGQPEQWPCPTLRALGVTD